MMVSRHIAFSLPPLAGAYLLGGLPGGALFFAGAVLIDFDHYLDYVLKEKRLGLADAYRYNIEINERALKRLNPEPIMNYFHTVEFFALVFLAALFLPPLRWLFAGMAFHITLDVVEILRKFDPGVRSFSIVGSMRRR